MINGPKVSLVRARWRYVGLAKSLVKVLRRTTINVAWRTNGERLLHLYSECLGRSQRGRSGRLGRTRGTISREA